MKYTEEQREINRLKSIETRPECIICGAGAQNQSRKKDGSILWRRVPKKLAKEKDLDLDSYVCSACHSNHVAKNRGLNSMAEVVAKNAGFDSVSEYNNSMAIEAGFESYTDYQNSKHPYRKHRKSYCENEDGRLGFKCTTTIVWTGMLDVDHKDGNPRNNDPENLQTLCKCCHSYKSNINEDYKSPGRKELGVKY